MTRSAAGCLDLRVIGLVGLKNLEDLRQVESQGNLWSLAQPVAAE
jgi:hypothetical protein